MIFNQRYIVIELFSQHKSFTSGSTTIKGIPSPFQKFFQRASQWSLIFNQEHSIFQFRLSASGSLH